MEGRILCFGTIGLDDEKATGKGQQEEETLIDAFESIGNLCMEAFHTGCTRPPVHLGSSSSHPQPQGSHIRKGLHKDPTSSLLPAKSNSNTLHSQTGSGALLSQKIIDESHVGKVVKSRAVHLGCHRLLWPLHGKVEIAVRTEAQSHEECA